MHLVQAERSNCSAQHITVFSFFRIIYNEFFKIIRHIFIAVFIVTTAGCYLLACDTDRPNVQVCPGNHTYGRHFVKIIVGGGGD